MTGGKFCRYTQVALKSLQTGFVIYIFKKFTGLKKKVTNFPIILCGCNFKLYFGGAFFGFFLPPIPPHLEIWTPLFKAWILQSECFSAEYISCFPWSMFFFSHTSCPVLLHPCVSVLFYLFVFKIVSSHTLCILLYSAPLSLRATDVANGNANGGRNNALSSTVSRPMPYSTSPSPGCAAGDQGKENLSIFFILSCIEC